MKLKKKKFSNDLNGDDVQSEFLCIMLWKDEDKSFTGLSNFTPICWAPDKIYQGHLKRLAVKCFIISLSELDRQESGWWNTASRVKITDIVSDFLIARYLWGILEKSLLTQISEAKLVV